MINYVAAKRNWQVSMGLFNHVHCTDFRTLVAFFFFGYHLTYYAAIATYKYAAKSFPKCIDECEQIGITTSIHVSRCYLNNFMFSNN